MKERKKYLPRQIELSREARSRLQEMRDQHPKSHMRERAAAILKIAEGQSIAQVAREGLLRRRKWETVAEWLNRYEQHGLGGLDIRPGRGRKPAFFP